MSCSTCGYEAASDFAFCPKCGDRLPRPCGSCGFSCDPEFAFCPRCGSAVGPPSDPGSPGPRPSRAPAPGDAGGETDRRLVTVLFADVSGFTTLSEGLDPEVVRAFQADLFRDLSSIVRRYGGFVEKYVGDAVMAVFGAPLAHENDPERALNTALTMHARMVSLNERWAARVGQELALHIGVNTGLVVAGRLGGGDDGAYAVTGDTVNTTARLQGIAGPGQTVVGEATTQLTRSAFTFEAIEEKQLKGKSSPMTLHLLTGRLRTPEGARGLGSYGIDSPTVGREADVDQIWAAFQRTLRGRAEVVSVIGEAGVGKSRVMEGFLERLRASDGGPDVAVRWVTCGALGQQSYGVPAALFRQAYDISDDEDVEAVRQKLSTGIVRLGVDPEQAGRMVTVLGHVLGLEAGGSEHGLEPEQLQKQIFLALRTLLDLRLRHGPLVVVVEDFHWVDGASVEVLRTMMDRLHDRSLMLLVDFRPSFDASALAGSRAGYTTVRLGRLSHRDCGALLETLLADSPGVPAEVREMIVERAGGHPFFLEEIVRSFIESGVLVRDAAGWSCPVGARAAEELPSSVQTLLAARLDRLPSGARPTLEATAVLGFEFRAELLAAVSGDQHWEEAVDALIEAEILEEAGGAAPAGGPTGVDRRYRFSHGMLRDVAYNRLLKSRRTALHRQAGLALEDLCGRDGELERLEDLVALGHHFRLGDERPRSAAYLLRAGDRSAAVYAVDDAIRYYRQALEAAEGCPGCEELRERARERLADLVGPRGERDQALTLYRALEEEFEKAGRHSDRARVWRKMGRVHWEAGERARALACFEQGLALLDGARGEIERAHLYQEMGRLAFRSGDHERAAVLARRALEEAESLGRDGDREAGSAELAAAISHAHNTLGIALARMHRMDEAVTSIERSVEVAGAQGLLGAACRGYANLGVLYATWNPAKAIETCLAGLEAAKRIGDLGLESCLHANLAVAYCALTDRCEAEGLAAAQAAIEIDRQLGQLDHLAVPLIVLGQIHQCQGRFDEALGFYGEALGVAQEIGEPQLIFPCYEGMATVHLDRGELTEAEALLLKGQEICESAGLEPESLIVLPFLS